MQDFTQYRNSTTMHAPPMLIVANYWSGIVIYKKTILTSYMLNATP